MGSNKPFKPSWKILENIPVHNTQRRLSVFYQTHSSIISAFVLVGYAADLYNHFPEIFSCASTFFGTWQFLACSSQQLAQLCNATEKIQELRLLCISFTAKELLAFKMAKQAIFITSYKAVWLNFAAENTEEEAGNQELRAFFHLLAPLVCISLLQAPEKKHIAWNLNSIK